MRYDRVNRVRKQNKDEINKLRLCLNGNRMHIVPH